MDVEMKLTARNTRKGFTLIELLVVIGILAILLAITLIAINPAKQFASANDTKRSSDVNSILNAIGQYMADNRGNLSGITGLSSTPTAIGGNTGQVNLCLLVPKYIAALPSDPSTGSPAGSVPCGSGQAAYNTNYMISTDAAGTGRITVSATPETAGTTITVTR